MAKQTGKKANLVSVDENLEGLDKAMDVMEAEAPVPSDSPAPDESELEMGSNNVRAHPPEEFDELEAAERSVAAKPAEWTRTIEFTKAKEQWRREIHMDDEITYRDASGNQRGVVISKTIGSVGVSRMNPPGLRVNVPVDDILIIHR